ncbi:hypothetical protein OE88DRAFT_1648776 [Heliocybe sulcata]|uniref:Uncharacterized protein n=1 Tax=Heliocybe sulcata TaxID=5364 RepID=A0A5C3MNB1_9AGAM|nr:hypothetical protein OE88DRAFT_1648776 [Heliocybe sulcata]
MVTAQQHCQLGTPRLSRDGRRRFTLHQLMLHAQSLGALLSDFKNLLELASGRNSTTTSRIQECPANEASNYETLWDGDMDAVEMVHTLYAGRLSAMFSMFASAEYLGRLTSTMSSSPSPSGTGQAGPPQVPQITPEFAAYIEQALHHEIEKVQQQSAQERQAMEVAQAAWQQALRAEYEQRERSSGDQPEHKARAGPRQRGCHNAEQLPGAVFLLTGTSFQRTGSISQRNQWSILETSLRHSITPAKASKESPQVSPASSCEVISEETCYAVQKALYTHIRILWRLERHQVPTLPPADVLRDFLACFSEAAHDVVAIHCGTRLLSALRIEPGYRGTGAFQRPANAGYHVQQSSVASTMQRNMPQVTPQSQLQIQGVVNAGIPSHTEGAVPNLESLPANRINSNRPGAFHAHQAFTPDLPRGPTPAQDAASTSPTGSNPSPLGNVPGLPPAPFNQHMLFQEQQKSSPSNHPFQPSALHLGAPFQPPIYPSPASTPAEAASTLLQFSNQNALAGMSRIDTMQFFPCDSLREARLFNASPEVFVNAMQQMQGELQLAKQEVIRLREHQDLSDQHVKTLDATLKLVLERISQLETINEKLVEESKKEHFDQLEGLRPTGEAYEVDKDDNDKKTWYPAWESRVNSKMNKQFLAALTATIVADEESRIKAGHSKYKACEEELVHSIATQYFQHVARRWKEYQTKDGQQKLEARRQVARWHGRRANVTQDRRKAAETFEILFQADGAEGMLETDYASSRHTYSERDLSDDAKACREQQHLGQGAWKAVGRKWRCKTYVTFLFLLDRIDRIIEDVQSSGVVVTRAGPEGEPAMKKLKAKKGRKKNNSKGVFYPAPRGDNMSSRPPSSNKRPLIVPTRGMVKPRYIVGLDSGDHFFMRNNPGWWDTWEEKYLKEGYLSERALAILAELSSDGSDYETDAARAEEAARAISVEI